MILPFFTTKSQLLLGWKNYLVIAPSSCIKACAKQRWKEMMVYTIKGSFPFTDIGRKLDK